MNIPQPETTAPPPVPPIRDAIAARIDSATLPVATKKLARKLLDENRHPGQPFPVSMTILRQMRHAVTNLDVLKDLRRMQRAGLIEYEIDYMAQKVTLKFVAKPEAE